MTHINIDKLLSYLRFYWITLKFPFQSDELSWKSWKSALGDQVFRQIGEVREKSHRQMTNSAILRHEIPRHDVTKSFSVNSSDLFSVIRQKFRHVPPKIGTIVDFEDSPDFSYR